MLGYAADSVRAGARVKISCEDVAGLVAVYAFDEAVDLLFFPGSVHETAGVRHVSGAYGHGCTMDIDSSFYVSSILIVVATCSLRLVYPTRRCTQYWEPGEDAIGEFVGMSVRTVER